MQDTTLSIAQLSTLFQNTDVTQEHGVTYVRVIEDSPQESFLRHVQMRAHGTSRFMREFKTLSAAAVPQYEFTFQADALQNSPYESAQKLGWVLNNKTSDTPYEFKPQF